MKIGGRDPWRGPHRKFKTFFINYLKRRNNEKLFGPSYYNANTDVCGLVINSYFICTLFISQVFKRDILHCEIPRCDGNFGTSNRRKWLKLIEALSNPDKY